MNKVALFEKILAIGRVLEINTLLANNHRELKKRNPRTAHQVWDCLDLCVRYLLLSEPEKMFPTSSGDVLTVALDNTFLAVSKVCTSDIGVRTLASKALVGNRNVLSQQLYLRMIHEWTHLDEVALPQLVKLLHQSIGYSESFREEWLKLTPQFGQRTGTGAKWRTLVRNLTWTAALDSLNIPVVETLYPNIVIGSITGRERAPKLYQMVRVLLEDDKAFVEEKLSADEVQTPAQTEPPAQLLPRGVSVRSEEGLLAVSAVFMPRDELPADVAKRFLRVNTTRIHAVPLLAPLLKKNEYHEICTLTRLEAVVRRAAEWHEAQKKALADQVPQILEALVDMEAFDLAKKLTKVLTAEEIALLRAQKDAVLVALTDIPMPQQLNRSGFRPASVA